MKSVHFRPWLSIRLACSVSAITALAGLLLVGPSGAMSIEPELAEFQRHMRAKYYMKEAALNPNDPESIMSHFNRTDTKYY